VGLNRICFFESYTSFRIAPWNPGAGLSFVLILVFGRQLVPLLFVARYWRISSIDKFTLPEEGGRIRFSIVFAKSPDRCRPRGPRRGRRQSASLLGIGLSLL
jgi:hypothetical protein